MLNKQGPGKIDWCNFSSNPISGCLHSCDYCYMLRMEKRFPGIMKPAFHPERLKDWRTLANKKEPQKVFVGSSGDMWGAWVNPQWIEIVLREVEKYPDHIFQFLTKNPIRYSEFDIPVNCWLGVTVDGTEESIDRFDIMFGRAIIDKPNKNFISFEPLLHEIPPVVKKHISLTDWVIIGANSNVGAESPPVRWAEELLMESRRTGVAVWIKDNYKYPDKIKEWP